MGNPFIDSDYGIGGAWTCEYVKTLDELLLPVCDNDATGLLIDAVDESVAFPAVCDAAILCLYRDFAGNLLLPQDRLLDALWPGKLAKSLHSAVGLFDQTSSVRKALIAVRVRGERYKNVWWGGRKGEARSMLVLERAPECGVPNKVVLQTNRHVIDGLEVYSESNCRNGTTLGECGEKGISVCSVQLIGKLIPAHAA